MASKKERAGGIVATPTYTSLANITLGSSAGSVTFSSIPATFRDLVLVANPKATATVNNLMLRFNGDSGSNYPGVWMRGTGSVAGSGTTNASFMYLDLLGAGVETNLDQTSRLQIMDYSATDKHKTVLVRFDDSSQATGAFANRWANTAAITTIELFISGTTFASGSNFALYAIAS